MKKVYAICLAFMGFATVVNAQTVIPTSNELILPQYAYYGGTSPAHRMPFVCRLTLRLGAANGNKTYRYFTGMSSTNNMTTQTPGNMYRINNGVSLAGYGNITGFAVTKAINSTEINFDEMRTDNTSRHGRFNTDANGDYTGWFACVPVGNTTQQNIGSNVYFYVQVNDGGTGTVLAQSFRTSSTIKLLNYTNVPGDASGCTPLLGTSNVSDEKMVAIYDNTAATGRPLYCTFTENNNQGGGLNEGTIWTNPVIYSVVDGVSGSWAAIIPNTLTGGVKAINFLNIPDASPITLSNAPLANTSNDGSWNGVSTANPAGDSTRPIVINSIQGALLPVSLLEFSGTATKEGVKLFWTTTQEVNNKYFEIRRAGSNGAFQAIGQVDAATAPALTNEYSFVDRQPHAGRNYYQLRQVDKDGKSKLYQTIYVNMGRQNLGIRLISNGSSEIAVAIEANENGTGTIIYTDIQGRILYNRTISMQQGENVIRIPDAGITKGVGVISFISSNAERMNLKIVR